MWNGVRALALWATSSAVVAGALVSLPPQNTLAVPPVTSDPNSPDITVIQRHTAKAATARISKISATKGTSNGGTKVTVTGSKFTKATKVFFGSVPAKRVSYKSSKKLVAVAPAHKAGKVYLYAVNQGLKSKKAKKTRFTFVAPPAIKKLSPSKGKTKGGFKVTITGTGFTKISKVLFDKTKAKKLKVKSSKKLTLTAPKHKAGWAKVKVVGKYGASNVLCFAYGTPTKASPCLKKPATPTLTAAARYLTSQIAELDRVAYVYRDYGDGANLFTQRAWLGSSYPDPAKGEKPPDPPDEQAEAHTGVSSVHARIDLKRFAWGGWQFQNGTLAAGSTQPQLNFGDTNAGFDLTGAARLEFWAKGTPGALVDFSVGGLGWPEGGVTYPYPDSLKKEALNRVELSDKWTKYQIDLRGKDLSRVAAGFALATGDYNSMDAVDIYVDEVRFVWETDRIRPLWIRSYAPLPTKHPDAFINNFSYTYDQSMAIIALIETGQVSRARQLADALTWAQAHDRTFKDGRVRNAYANGPGYSFPGWDSTNGPDFAMLPGYYLDDKWVEDYYADSTSTGVVAWAILALTRSYEVSPGRTDYRDAALALGRWALARKATMGFSGGEEGFDTAQTPATYGSTEHNVDLVTAFARLAKLTSDSAERQRFQDGSKHAEAFVRAMLVTNDGAPYFATGTGADGVTINKDVIPLDAQTWTLLALGPDTVPQAGAIVKGLGRFAAPGGGYDFNTDRDGAWLEGTAQVAVLNKTMSDASAAANVLKYLHSKQLADGSVPSASIDGLTTGFKVSGLDQEWIYSRRAHVGATAWLILAERGANPLKP